MPANEYLLAIADYRQLLEQNLRIAQDTERRLAENPSTADQIACMDPQLRERERDYKVLIRATDVLKRRFCAGLFWEATRDEIERMDVAINEKHASLGATLYAMRKLVSRAA